MVFAKFYGDFTQILRKKLPPLAASQAATPFGSHFLAIRNILPPLRHPYLPANQRPSAHCTQTAANDSIWRILKVIETALKNYAWYHEGGYRSIPPGVSLIHSIEQKMKIQLRSSTRVTAKSDGGLPLYTNAASCSYPVFCLEVTLSPAVLTLGEMKETSIT